MNIRWQTTFFIALIIISLAITQFGRDQRSFFTSSQADNTHIIDSSESVIADSNSNQAVASPTRPVRRWDVLDPEVDAQAVLVESLEDGLPFFNYQTTKPWPIASLTKLLTAVVVIEDIGSNKKIGVSVQALKTEGEAGSLRAGEIYLAEDLMKIMLLTSSNDAAAAFEEYAGGKDELAKLLNRKAEKLGMLNTIVHDASGLSDLNESTAADLRILLRYVIEKHSDLIAWTRLQQFLVQPVNVPRSHTVYNINNLSRDTRFLGGKTGTSPEALENLLAVVSAPRGRMIVVLLGSGDRMHTFEKLLAWVEGAYVF